MLRPALAGRRRNFQTQDLVPAASSSRQATSQEDLNSLWKAALDEYCQSLHVDLCAYKYPFNRDPERSWTCDEILDVLLGVTGNDRTVNRKPGWILTSPLCVSVSIWSMLVTKELHDRDLRRAVFDHFPSPRVQEGSQCLTVKRQGSGPSRRLREALKPLIRGLSVILDACGETASALGIPGGKGIFAAVAVLLAAADRVSTSYDQLQKLLERLRAYVERLQVRLQVPLKSESRKVAVKALVEVLKALALVTHMLQRGRIGQFVRTVFSRGDEVQDALEALGDATSEEERMAVAELVVDMEDLSSGMHDIGTSLSTMHVTLGVAIGELVVNMEDISSEVHNIGTSVSTLQVTLGDAWQDTRHTNQEVLAELHERGRKYDEMFNAFKSWQKTMTDQLSRLETRGQHVDQPDRTVAVRPAPKVPFQGGRLIKAMSTLGPEDRNTIWRGLARLFFRAMGTANGVVDSTTSTAPQDVAEVIESITPTACTLLLLFMTWKLASISRPLRRPPDTVLIIDALGEILVLEPDVFTTWENTHEFLLEAFQNRTGISYVRGRKYALSDSERLLIDPESWPRVVKAGSKLRMSIVIRELACLCPYCKTSPSGNELRSGLGFIFCARCKRPYGRHEKAMDPTPAHDENKPPIRLHSEHGNLKEPPKFPTVPITRDDHQDLAGATTDAALHVFERIIVEYHERSRLRDGPKNGEGSVPLGARQPRRNDTPSRPMNSPNQLHSAPSRGTNRAAPTTNGSSVSSEPPRRPRTIAELAEIAKHLGTDDDGLTLKQYLRNAERARIAGRHLQDEGDMENAFIQLARAATIVLEKLPAHKDYRHLLNSVQRHNMGLHGQEILGQLATIKLTLTETYERHLSSSTLSAPAFSQFYTSLSAHDTEFAREENTRRAEEKKSYEQQQGEMKSRGEDILRRRRQEQGGIALRQREAERAAQAARSAPIATPANTPFEQTEAHDHRPSSSAVHTPPLPRSTSRSPGPRPFHPALHSRPPQPPPGPLNTTRYGTPGGGRRLARYADEHVAPSDSRSQFAISILDYPHEEQRRAEERERYEQQQEEMVRRGKDIYRRRREEKYGIAQRQREAEMAAQAARSISTASMSTPNAVPVVR
ncbi:unnamed protein product [Peniophora sp. CBMAI 1063]|nr:unnamed protein product [Peniophora sp. CBMAI 1063]